MKVIVIFNGSNIESIKESLAKVLRINEDKLIKKIVFYYWRNVKKFDDINSIYYDFCEFIGLDGDEEWLKFDYAYIFHIISTIDNLETINKFGLIDLRETLNKQTALSNYLRNQGISFDLKNGINIIINDKSYDLGKYNSDEAISDKEYWKAYYAEYLFNRLNFDYNLNGFLFLENAYNDSSYKDLKNKSEFFDRLSNYVEDKDIYLKWQENSESYILKCKIDCGQVTLGNGLTWPTKHEVAKRIIEISIRSIIDFEIRADEVLPITYILVKYGVKIPIDNIEAIKWNESLEGNE